MADRVVGRIPVLESLRAGKRTPRRLFIVKGGRGFEDILQAAAAVPVAERPRRELDQLAQGVVHQGVVLEADPLPIRDLDDWLAALTVDDAVAVVLDSIEDPHNFGAIVRSAAAFGAAGVIFAKDRAAPISPAAVKSAAGGMEHVDLIRVTNLARGIQRIQEHRFWVAALDASGDTGLWEADFTGRVALVIGSEGQGLRPLVLKHCDYRVAIPLTGSVNALNASTTAAIALAECARQRQ